jgi:ABC-type lipoprotein release transport system permease subunit
LLRSLIYYGRLNLAVLLGSAVAATVLCGALLVGDSMRGSLRALALDRLGRIDSVITSERFLREELAGELGGSSGGTAVGPRLRPDVAPIVMLRGSAVHAGSQARASRIAVLGVDRRFAALYPGADSGAAAVVLDLERRPGQVFPPVVLNRSLQQELGAAAGDQILLSFARSGDIPRASLVGRRDPVDVLGLLRCTVAGIIEDRGPGRFALSAQQAQPGNAYVALADLQRALDLPGRANAFLIASTPGAAGGEPSRGGSDGAAGSGGIAGPLGRLSLDDLGLMVEPRDEFVSVESREFLLRDAAVTALEAAAGQLGTPVQRVQTYLANGIAAGDRSIPYSMLTAIDAAGGGPFPALRLTDGSPAPPLEEDEILLNSWAAEDLGAHAGTVIEVTYFVVGADDALHETTVDLRLRGVVTMQGLGADRGLTPHYPGIEDADSMAAWDPPFPVDLKRVRPHDEDYWDRYRATPKGFVSASAGRTLWSNRFGTATALRVAVPSGMTPERLAADLRGSLRQRIDPAAVGIRLLPARADGLRAAAGATDFSGLFFGFSMFLIGAAALLAGLLFRLGVEQRAAEVGILLAVGFPPAAVRRRFLAEGLVLASAGAVAGLAGGIGYAWLLMAGLRTVWRPAVGSSELYLYVGPMSLAIGALLSIGLVLASIYTTIRQLGELPAARLLAGSLRSPERLRRAGGMARWAAWGGLAAALFLFGTALATGSASSPGLAFGTGALLLISGLSFFALWCRRPRHLRFTGRSAASLAAMAARNSAWNPGRSLLSVSLIAAACFVIIAVAAQHHDPRDEAGGLETGGGGYTLVAETDIPLYQDLEQESGRAELGFQPGAADTLRDVTIMPFRLLPGDDASCLNLYRPGRPRILGAPPQQVRRGGFRFLRLAEPADDPWTLLDREIAPGVVPAFGDANSVQWILHLGLGQDLILRDDHGREVTLRLVGLFGSSLLQSEIVIAEQFFVRHFPSRSGYSYFLIDAPAERAAAVRQELESTLRPFGFDATGVGDKLAAYHVVQNTYLSTFQTLGGLGLLLGTLGLGVVLVRNIIERRGELATLRAFGFRRSRLAALVLAENAFVLLLGVALGGGSALVAVAPHLLQVGARFPWLSLAATIGAVVPFGMLASLAAVRLTLQAPLLPALKAER